VGSYGAQSVDPRYAVPGQDPRYAVPGQDPRDALPGQAAPYPVAAQDAGYPGIVDERDATSAYDVTGRERVAGRADRRRRGGRDADVRRERSGLTPGRILFAIVALASLALVAYGFLFERGGLQLPIMVSGLVMAGISLIVLAFLALASLVRAGRQGSGGRAFGWALVGGIAALVAAGSLASAVILVMLLGST
jgi:hypothetical protein